jgi:hypothetical protein
MVLSKQRSQPRAVRIGTAKSENPAIAVFWLSFAPFRQPQSDRWFSGDSRKEEKETKKITGGVQAVFSSSSCYFG